MNSPSVLILSALTLGLQVKIAGNIYVLKENQLYQLHFKGTEADKGLILKSTLAEKKLYFKDFLTLSQQMTPQETMTLHDILSQQGALKHA